MRQTATLMFGDLLSYIEQERMGNLTLEVESKAYEEFQKTNDTLLYQLLLYKNTAKERFLLLSGEHKEKELESLRPLIPYLRTHTSQYPTLVSIIERLDQHSNLISAEQYAMIRYLTQDSFLDKLSPLDKLKLHVNELKEHTDHDLFIKKANGTFKYNSLDYQKIDNYKPKKRDY
ncbi:hypothetical protein P9112_002668 [Eukaryota sp. TZLM1-RC]